MKSRDIVLQCLTAPAGRLTTERRPVALLSGGLWTFRQQGYDLEDMLHRPVLAAQVIVQMNELVKSDIVWPGSGFHNVLVDIFGGKIKFRPQGNIDVVQPAFSSPADFNSIPPANLNEHPWIYSIREMIAQVSQAIGRHTVIGTSSWGPFTLAGQFYGVEKLMTGLYKDKAVIHALLEITSEICYQYLAGAVDKGAEILSVAEPTASGDLISLPHFEEFVAPSIAALVKRLKARGAYMALHICGNIANRVQLIPDLGVDLLSVDYKVAINKAVQLVEDKIVLAGNVNPVLLKDGNRQQVIAAARHCLTEAGDHTRFILMPGCDIPAGVPLENIISFIETGLQKVE